MELFQALILGIIQGISEWLPISSEAMVTLAGRFLFDMDYNDALTTSLYLHSGTLLSAVIYFRKDILEILKFENKELIRFLIISSLVSGFIGAPLLFFALNFAVPDSLFTIMIGGFMITLGFLYKKSKIEETQKMIDDRSSIISGATQGLSALPGISRSGITTTIFLTLKYPLKQAFKYSFLMSIPVVFGLQVFLPMLKPDFVIEPNLIFGAIVAAIVGLITIESLMRFAEKVNFSSSMFALGAFVLIIGFLII